MGKREETELKILESAVDIIAEKGYSATKTQEIASAAGTSEATLFKYYKNKKGLLLSIVNHAIHVLGERIVVKPISEILINKSTLPFDEVLDCIIQDRIAMVEKQKAIITVLIHEIQYHDEVRKAVYEGIYKPVSKQFIDFYEIQTSLGHVRRVDNPEQIFKMFIALFLQPVMQLILTDEPLDIDVLISTYDETKQFMIRGVRP